MIAEPAQQLAEPETFPAWRLVALVGAIGLGCIAALLLTGGNPALVFAPLIIPAFFYGLWKAELRTSTLLLLLAILVLPNPGESPSSGVWKSPILPLGALLMSNLNSTTGLGALHFAGLDALMALLIGLIIYRRSRGQRIGGVGQIETATPMAQAALVSLGTLLLLWVYGVARGGDFKGSLQQVPKLIYLPVLFFLFQATLAGPRDHRLLARLIIGAACYKAVEAIWVRHLFPAMSNDQLPYVNTHSDSVLYATATAILIGAFILHPVRPRLIRCAVFLPLIFLGMKDNNRRLAWVELAAVIIVLLAMMPRNKLKRALFRGAIMAAPIAALYLVVGWDSGAGFFRPVKLLKSVVSSEADRSTETRDVENFNLICTLAAGPIWGPGFGHEYLEMVKGDDISRYFPEYRYVPHNSFLGLLAFGGVVGYSGIVFELAMGIFLAARSFRAARSPDDRVAAFVVIAIVVIFLIQAYGDMGAMSWIGVFLVATALAMVGKLVISVGAWPSRKPRPASPVPMASAELA